MHTLSQNRRIETDVSVSSAFTICDLEYVLKKITKNAVTRSETARSANMCVCFMFVHHFSIRHFLFNAECHLHVF